MPLEKSDKTIEFSHVTLATLESVAKKVAELLVHQKLLLFYGEMGAGKTTFIKKLCTVLGVSDSVSSPTFALMHEYKSAQNTIYHFDLHRLKSIQEAIDFGIFEYLDSDYICIIEWPQIIEDILEEFPNIKIHISNEIDMPEIRKFEIKINNASF